MKNLEEHQVNLGNYLDFALREAQRMAFNVKYNSAQLSKVGLHTLHLKVSELRAIIKNEEAKATHP